MPAMKKRKADGPVVVNVETSAPRRTYKKKGYAARASSNWKKFSKLKPWSDFGAMRYPRGTPEGISRFGETYAQATPDQRQERADVGWYGRGMYTGRGGYNPGKQFRRWATGAIKNVGKGVGAAANEQILGAMSMAGDYAGTGMYTGRGLYEANSLIDSGMSRQSMEFSSPNDETQSLIISHKEYVGDVFAPATAAFTNTSYEINPGLQQNFPFLAQFAQNFDEYELIQMVWEFHSTIDASATNNTAGNTGTIVMATNYKADSPAFQTKEEMIQYHGGVSGRLTESLCHGVECDPSKNALGSGKFIRTQTVANSDVKTFDMGTFQLALQNIPSAFFNQQVGELWVYYQVKLSKPKLFTALGNGIQAARFLSHGGETGTLPMGTDILRAQANTIAASIVNGSRNVIITFPATLSGVFEVKMLMEGTTFASGGTVGPSVAGNVGGFTDIYASFVDATDNPVYYTVTISPTTCIAICRITLKAATGGVDNKLTIYPLGTLGTAATVTQTTVEIMEVGTSFATSNTVQAPIWINASNVVTSSSA